MAVQRVVERIEPFPIKPARALDMSVEMTLDAVLPQCSLQKRRRVTILIVFFVRQIAVKRFGRDDPAHADARKQHLGKAARVDHAFRAAQRLDGGVAFPAEAQLLVESVL